MDFSTRTTLLCLLSGILFGVGWWMFIDAAAYAKTSNDRQQITFPFVLIGLVATAAMFLLNVFPWASLQEGMDPVYSARAKCALFTSVSLLLGCILGAIWVLAAVYVPARDRADSSWPGAALLLQTAFIFIAAVTMRFARASTLF